MMRGHGKVPIVAGAFHFPNDVVDPVRDEHIGQDCFIDWASGAASARRLADDGARLRLGTVLRVLDDGVLVAVASRESEHTEPDAERAAPRVVCRVRFGDEQDERRVFDAVPRRGDAIARRVVGPGRVQLWRVREVVWNTTGEAVLVCVDEQRDEDMPTGARHDRR